MHRQDPGVVQLLITLAAAVSGDAAALAYLGVGPIEDLLTRCRPSARLLEELDSAVRFYPDLRVAMTHVWWSEDDDPGVVARFRLLG